MLGDHRVLVSFDSNEKCSTFLSMEEEFKEFFSDIYAWNNQVAASNRLVWINVRGIPFKFWTMEFLKSIGNSCGEFIMVSKPTLNRRRLDLASILVSTSQNQIPSTLIFMINGEKVQLVIVETSVPIDMVDDEEEESSDDDDVEEKRFSSANSDSSVSDKDQNFQNLILDNSIDPLSCVPNSLQSHDIRQPEDRQTKAATLHNNVSHNGPQTEPKMQTTGPRKMMIVDPDNFLKSKRTESLSGSDVRNRNKAI